MVGSSNIPDFGVIRIEEDDVVLEAKAVVPGLCFQDLVEVFYEAEKDFKPVDNLSGNPTVWQNNRGINAVIQATLNAIYSEKKDT